MAVVNALIAFERLNFKYNKLRGQSFPYANIWERVKFLKKKYKKLISKKFVFDTLSTKLYLLAALAFFLLFPCPYMGV